MKKVLMLLNNHYSHDPRVTAEAESLIKYGFEVKVIAWDKKRKYLPHEIINNVEVIRIRIPKILDKLIPFELLKVPIWQVMAYKKAMELYKHWKFEVVHVHDWPDLPPGSWLKKKLKVKLLYDSHEVWTYMFIGGKLPRIISEFLFKERYLISKYVDVLITVGKEYKRYFLPLFPKVIIITNSKTRVQVWSRPKTKTLRLVYIGGFDSERCLYEITNAIKDLCYAELILAGAFPEHFKKLISKRDNIKYLGIIPKELVLEKTLFSNIVFYVFRDKVPLYKIGMPNKLFEAIATGRMSLAGKNTDSGRFVEEYKIGISISCDKKEIKKVLGLLRENPKLIIKFGRRAYKVGKKYNWNNESKKLVGIYKKLIGGI